MVKDSRQNCINVNKEVIFHVSQHARTVFIQTLIYVEDRHSELMYWTCRWRLTKGFLISKQTALCWSYFYGAWICSSTHISEIIWRELHHKDFLRSKHWQAGFFHSVWHKTKTWYLNIGILCRYINQKTNVYIN